MSNKFGIPTVDLSEFLSEDYNLKLKFVNQLGEAYEDIGFVAVRNHEISNEIIDRLYKIVEEFFALPAKVKSKYEIEGIGGARGFTSFGKEHAKNRKAGDLKEFWHFGQFIQGNDSIAKEYYENISVDELPEFIKIGKEAYRAFEKAGKHMLRAIALYLGLDEFYFDKPIFNGNSILRPIYYPPLMNPKPDAVRAGEHEDINLITLLVGASADGLQVLNRQGEWISVTAIPDHIIVNVGDMLQRLTNNKLRSTTHRVINPPKELWHTPRYSMPFFLHPRSDMLLNCLPECIDGKTPKQYKDITAGEYLEERLREIGLL